MVKINDQNSIRLKKQPDLDAETLIEPRVFKRRRHGYPLMQEPRQVLRNRLLSGNTKD